MIKLVDILKELSLNEKIIKVPQEVLDRTKEVYDYIQTNLETFKQKAPKSYDKPLIPSKLKHFFKLKDLKGADLSVSVGLYNDPEDAGAGRMDTVKDNLLVNLAFLVDYEEFDDLVEHELIHAMDPKVRDVKVFGKMYAKKGAEPTSDAGMMDKYLKSPWEFDAFTAPLINKIVFSVNKLPAESKQQYKTLLKQLLSDIKTQSADQILRNDNYAPLAWLFTKKEWNEENWSAAWASFANEITKIKSWTTKPTLYKRFLQRLAKEVY